MRGESGHNRSTGIAAITCEPGGCADENHCHGAMLSAPIIV
jgi:hypothetical protein